MSPVLHPVPDLCKCHEKTKLICNSRTFVSLPQTIPKETTTLDLSQNKIAEINQEEFASLSELEVVILDFNWILNFTTEIFPSRSIVREIHLQGNRLTALEAGQFTNLTSLTHLDLSRNQISTIQDNAFGILPALETLNLRTNLITEIQPHYFRNLHSLKTLYLSDNRITSIHKHSLVTLVNLEILDLATNAISRLDNEVLDGLHNLSTLLLTRNEISTIKSMAFKDLSKVKSIDLRCNSLRRLDNETFRMLHSLHYIYFDKFYMCLYASQSRVCEPQGDGISNKEDLLGNTILRVCVWLVALLACAGNLLVILGRFLMKEDNQIHSFFIKNLSLADLLMGCYLFVIAANDMKFRGDYIVYDEIWRNSWECDLCGFLSTLSTEMSVLTLSVITLDRYISIMYPLSFRKRGLKCAYLVMTITWLVCVILAALPVMGIDYFGSVFYSDNAVCVPLHLHEPRAKGWEYSAFIFLGINFGSFAFIAYAYVAMFYSIHMSALPLRTSRECHEMSLVKRFFFIVVTDFLCWVPIIIIKIMALGGVKVSDDLYAWMVVFALPVNSALNPLLYTLTTNLFKRKLLAKFTIVFRAGSTQYPSSIKTTSLARQMPDCEVNLIKHNYRSPSRCTIQTYLSPRVSEHSTEDNRGVASPSSDLCHTVVQKGY